MFHNSGSNNCFSVPRVRVFAFWNLKLCLNVHMSEWVVPMGGPMSFPPSPASKKSRVRRCGFSSMMATSGGSWMCCGAHTQRQHTFPHIILCQPYQPLEQSTAWLHDSLCNTCILSFFLSKRRNDSHARCTASDASNSLHGALPVARSVFYSIH